MSVLGESVMGARCCVLLERGAGGGLGWYVCMESTYIRRGRNKFVEMLFFVS